MAAKKRKTKKNSSFIKKHTAEIISAVVVLVLILFNFVYKLIPIFVEQFHCRFFYKLFMVPISFLTGFLPFSLIEILAALIVLMFVFILIKKRKYFVKALCITISIIFFFYTISLSMNYNRMPADISFDIPLMTSSDVDVEKALNHTINKLNELVPQIKFENGVSSYNKSIREMSTQTNNTYKIMEKKYDFIKGGVVYPKPMLSSKLMSYTGITGFFSPITMEANIDSMYPDFSLPQTMCHEGAHLKGFARENECEFISFVACINSEDDYFVYSGYMSAYNQLANELYSKNQDLYNKTISNVDEKIKSEWNAYFEYSKKHEGKTQDIFEKANNAYIVSQGDEAGTASYSQDVELIIAYLKSQEHTH